MRAESNSGPSGADLPADSKMDFSGHMILPKGFVVNNEDIYKEVASYPVVPPEKIREYWGGKSTLASRMLLGANRRHRSLTLLFFSAPLSGTSTLMTLRSIYYDVPPSHRPHCQSPGALLVACLGK